MKVLRFTIRKHQASQLLHNVQALIKHSDKTTNARFVACNLLEGYDSVGWLKKMFGIKEKVKIIVQIDRGEDYGKGLSKVQR